MNITYNQAVTLLLGIVLISSLLNYRINKIPDGYIKIIGNDEVINYVEQYNTMDSLRAPVVLDTTFLFPSDTIDRPDLKQWMKRYGSGIRFKFHPW